jgi:hypothetical protein
MGDFPDHFSVKTSNLAMEMLEIERSLRVASGIMRNESGVKILYFGFGFDHNGRRWLMRPCLAWSWSCSRL